MYSSNLKRFLSTSKESLLFCAKKRGVDISWL
nr:MAG TPA: ATP-grasp-like domain protein [Caudoviricetes sp.]